MAFSSSASDADNRSQLEALFDFATIGIVVTAESGNIINFNNLAQTQFGYTREEVLDRPVELLIPHAMAGRHRQYRHGFNQHPHPRSMGHGRDLFAQRKDGSVFPVEVSLSHYRIGNKLYVIAFIIDITVRKGNQEQLEQQKEELEKLTDDLTRLNLELEQKISERTRLLQEALQELQQSQQELQAALQNERELNELKSRFVTMASHEFRTPLSTILSSAYLAEQYTLQHRADKATHHLGRIRDAVHGMKNLLEDFLSLGKLEEGYVKAEMQWLAADTVFAGIRNELQQLDSIRKPGQQLLLETSTTTEKKIYADWSLLKNTLINLLSNAIKFSPGGSVITVRARQLEDHFELSVADQGMGISAEDQQHLFRRFFRARGAAHIPGTGLGLHIIAKYLEQMQGSITCYSVPEKGTTFTVTIPRPVV